MRNPLTILAALLALSAAGCCRRSLNPQKGDGAALEAPAGLAPTVNVSSAGVVTCVGRECGGSLQIAPSGRLSLRAPPGTVVEFAGSLMVANARGVVDAEVALPLSTPLKDLPISRLCASGQPLGSTTLALTFPDGAKASTGVTLTSDQAAQGVSGALAGAKGAAAPFPWEGRGARPPRARRAALFVDGKRCTPGGAADAPLSDVVVVATEESTAERTGTCDYRVREMKSGRSRGTASGRLTLHDRLAVAYDRTTGKRLKARRFNATKECDSTIELAGASSTIRDQDSYVSDATISAWAATLAR